MTMRALLFAPLFVALLSAAERDQGAFTSVVWRGNANYDSKGKFSDCTMTAQSKTGVLLGFVISKDFDWGLVLADERRKFDVGTTQAVVLLIDARKPISAIAKVINAHGILILDALRHGKLVTIVAEGASQASGSPAREKRSLRLPLASRGTAASKWWSYPRKRRPEVSSCRISGA
jgi:hypothetical protein